MGNVQNASEKQEGHSQLHFAAKRGDTEAVTSLLWKSANVDALDTEHNTPLHYASQHGHVDIVNLLLSENASVNSRNAMEQTSLHLAAKRGHLATVKSLLNSNADVNAVCGQQAAPLHVAAEHGHLNIVQSLISNGAAVNACDKAKMTALHLASQNGHTSIVQILVDNHATVDVLKQSEETPFYLAAKNGHADVTDLLLSLGISNFVLIHGRQTPLHVAVRNGYKEVAEVILKHSSRIYEIGLLASNSQEANEKNDSLIETSGIQPVQLLGSDGRRVSAGLVWTEKTKPLVLLRDSDGHTAIDLAVDSIQPKMVQLLLSADQYTYSERHFTRSFYRLIVAFNRQNDTYRRNDEETAKVQNDREQYQMFYDNVKEIAKTLINFSAFNVNHQDMNGLSPLHEVMKFKAEPFSEPGNNIQTIHMYLMQLLLEKGANVNLKNSFGETPLMIASETGCCDVIQILFDWGKKSGIKLELDARDQYGETALIKAAERTHVSVIRLLLNHKASLNLSDYYGFTALHAVFHETNSNWFDFNFFCKGFRNFCGVKSLLLCCRRRPHFRFSRETVDLRTVIDRLQSYVHYKQRRIRLIEDVVKLLIDNNEINVNAIDFRGNTPLDLAMKSSKRINSATFKALMVRGAIRKSQEQTDLAPIEVVRVDERGRNPLHRLIISRISDRQLENHGTRNIIAASIERSQDGKKFDIMIDGILLSPDDFRESVNATDNKGRTPLHYVVMPQLLNRDFQYRNPLTVLLEIGSAVNVADMYGKTPLHYAAENYLYWSLVYYGADENTKDNFGYSPRDLKQLQDDVATASEGKAGTWTSLSLYLPIDIVQLFNTNHVTELTKRKMVETIRVYSQSPSPQESSEEAVWKIWTENEFLRLNRRLNQLKPLVKYFIERLADGIKKKDWRFECQPILVGSAEEETQARMSADFDFNFRLIKFSEFCDPFPHPLGPKGYFELRRKTTDDRKSRVDDTFDNFFSLDNCLLTNEVNSRFKIILEEVLSDPDLWQGEHLFDWNMNQKYSSRCLYPGGLCKTVNLRMINPIEDGDGGFLFVNISIDIVACIHVEDWWPEDKLTVGISQTAELSGCTFVFHRPSFRHCKPSGTHFIFSETFAKISFATLESRKIKQSAPLIKAAYVVCKLLLIEKYGATYQLKTCLLFCMDFPNASEARKEEKITPKQLFYWVERLMFRFMEFSLKGIYPCYFMPSFRLKAVQLPEINTPHLKRMDDKSGVYSDILKDFCFCCVYGYYLDLCPDGSTFDIPTCREGQIRELQRYRSTSNSDPIWERYEQDEVS